MSAVGNVERPLELYERIIAAGGAGAVASILVNPLDVVKTRMQAQAIAKQRAPAELFSRAGIETRNWVLSNGMYTWPTRNPHEAPLYIHRPPFVQYRSTMDGLMQIGRSEGFRSLYRGMDMNLLVGVPMVCLYLPAYDGLSTWFNQQGCNGFSPLLAGMAARTIAVMATSPFELIKTRLQSAASSGLSYRNVWSSLALNQQAGILRKVQTLWMGCGATLLKDVPFAGLYWSLLEPFKSIISQELRLRPDSPRSHVLAANGTAGAAAGGLAAISTIPFDVIKTHMQTSENKNLRMMDAGKEIVCSKGWSALFTGWGPRGLRVAIAYLVLMTSYEECKQWCQSDASWTSQFRNSSSQPYTSPAGGD